VLNANKLDATSQAQQPDGLAANGGGCDRIPLWRASINGKITPNGLGIWGIFGFLAFVAALLLVWPLSGVFAGSAAASEGEEPAQPASFVTWHTDNFFTQCDGNCAVSVFGGPQLLTHQYDIFVHFKPAWEWRFGNTDLIGGAISRRILTLWDSLDIESEFGVAKRFGNMHAEEAWLVLYFRWTRFPWNQYLRTSIAITSGPSFTVDLPRNTHKNATVLNYFSPQITFALPQYPQYELMVQIHHRSNIVDFGKGGTPDPGWQFLTVGLHYRF
jgi:hypothetical protein